MASASRTESSGLRPSSQGMPGSLGTGPTSRMGLGASGSSSFRADGRQIQSRGPPTPLVPEGLPSRGVIEPLGSLAYLQHRSAFAFSPALEMPLPPLSLPPRLAAYPLKRRLVCGQGDEGSFVPSVIDAAAAQQLLTPFDAAGLLPSLVNPLGYPRLLLDPPLPSPPREPRGPPGASPAHQHRQQQQQKRPLASADAMKECLESLHQDDLTLVLDTLPEIPDSLRRSLRQRIRQGQGPSSGAPGQDSGVLNAAASASQQQRQGTRPQHQRVSFMHPSKPHLKVKRVLRVLPHPSASGVRLVQVGLDVPPAEKKVLALPPSTRAGQEQQGQEQQQERGQQQELQHDRSRRGALSWALLLPSSGSGGGDAVTYALYLRDAQKEAADSEAATPTASAAAAATGAGRGPEERGEQQQPYSYGFRRDYVWQPSAAAGGAAGTERAVVLVLPPPPSDSSPQRSERLRDEEGEECLMLQLAGPRRVLLKAGGSRRRPGVLAFAGAKEGRQREPEDVDEVERLESDATAGPGQSQRDAEEGPRRGGEGPRAEEEEGERDEGRQLFTEEPGDEQEEEEEPEATSGSGGSSSSSDGDSSSDSSQGDDD